MIPVQLACSVNCVKTVLDSVGQLSTLIVAIVGFITAMIVAKVTSGLELKRALCLKRVEAYELATRQLWQLITVYENDKTNDDEKSKEGIKQGMYGTVRFDQNADTVHFFQERFMVE